MLGRAMDEREEIGRHKKRKVDKEYSEDTHRIDLNDRAEPVLGEARDGREEVASGACRKRVSIRVYSRLIESIGSL